MTRRSVWIVLAVLVVAVVLAGNWFVRHGWLRVQVALAEEQTLYFEGARQKALQSSRPEEIVGFIEGTLNYYPSGTKQTAGSHLDRMVERARRLAVEDLIRQLKQLVSATPDQKIVMPGLEESEMMLSDRRALAKRWGACAEPVWNSI
jgi:hypothetical protein